MEQICSWPSNNFPNSLCSEKTVNDFLTNLAQLVEEMPPECWMKSTFINELLSQVRELLRLSTRMETLTLRELLERELLVP